MPINEGAAFTNDCVKKILRRVSDDRLCGKLTYQRVMPQAKHQGWEGADVYIIARPSINFRKPKGTCGICLCLEQESGTLQGCLEFLCRRTLPKIT
jgi:hypothetical protein